MRLVCVHAGVGWHSIALATGVAFVVFMVFVVRGGAGGVAIDPRVILVGMGGVGVSVVLIGSGDGVGGIGVSLRQQWCWCWWR